MLATLELQREQVAAVLTPADESPEEQPELARAFEVSCCVCWTCSLMCKCSLMCVLVQWDVSPEQWVAAEEPVRCVQIVSMLSGVVSLATC